jgi:transcriptional regulator with XRE-family HTH domain
MYTKIMEVKNNRISVLRKHLDLNQSEFARKLGVTSTLINKIEAGKTPLTETNIRLICFTFGVNEAWLRDGTGDMMNEEALLSDWEKRLLELFRKLSPRARELLIEYADKLGSDERALRGEPPQTVHRAKEGITYPPQVPAEEAPAVTPRQAG